MEAVKKTKRVSGKNAPKISLRPVDELPAKYRDVFQPYTTFNVVQSSVFDCLLASDSPVVVSAPTGSGKTTLFELAIIRLVETCHLESSNLGGNKIVYLAPVKALCSERYSDWSNKFRSLGLRTTEVTGDSTDLVELKTIENVDLILTTPEKWDSLTRRWKDHSGLVQLIKLFLIDEVHLLNEERRGPTLEAVVSRMKAVDALKPSENKSQVRFVAVSATIPNISDVAQWLGTPECPAKFFKFDESMRPVDLKKIVLGYPLRSKDKAYAFDLSLTYKLKQIIQTHANGKPTLIFCSTRKSVQQTCNTLKKTLSFNFTREQMEKLAEATSRITDNNLRELVKHGLAYHHAGLMFSDRQCLEEIFRTGYLPVLISTSTLAMGVNLPAHLVIIKSTEQYVCGEWQPYSESQILQMMGRAGRPQFDSTATAVIMTRDTNKGKYEKLMSGEELVESSLHNHLVEHLNSEIVLGTITDIAVAMNWLRSTFLYIRALKNPKHYGMAPNLTEREIESKLQAMCMRELHALEKYELITTLNFAYSVEPTENGKLMARYYIAFETMKVFMKIGGSETLPQLLELLTHCHEFQEIQLRRHEKPILNSLNRNKGKESIRFPIPGKITTKSAKANVLMQAVLGSLQIPDAGLLQESTKVMRLAERLLRGMTLYLGRKSDFEAYASALTLHKCSVARMWENSPMVCRQLPGIGPALGALLVSAGKRTFRDIVETDPRTLERIINRQPPMGNTLQEAALRMPQYDVDIVINEASSAVQAHVQMMNSHEVQYGNMLHKFTLILSAGNKILRKEIVGDQTLIIQRGYTIQAYAGDVIREASEVTVSLISQSIVGVDLTAKLVPISCNTVPSQAQGNFPESNQPKSSKQQIKHKANSKPKKPSAVPSSLDKYSFQPSCAKKLTKHSRVDKSNSSVTEISKDSKASELRTDSKTSVNVEGSLTGTYVDGKIYEKKSKTGDDCQVADNSTMDVIEILTSSCSSSGGGIGPTTDAVQGAGMNDQPNTSHVAMLKFQTQIARKFGDKTTISTFPAVDGESEQEAEPKGSEDPVKWTEDLGFDIDELFHSSSNEKLPEGDNIKDDAPVETSEDLIEDDVTPSTAEVDDLLIKSSSSVGTGQRLEPPLTLSPIRPENDGQVIDEFAAFADHTCDSSHAGDLNDLFLEMSNEDVGCTAMQASGLPNNDLQSQGFKLNEIPMKLRVEYDDVPNNTGRFGWKPPKMEHRTEQVAQEFIATQSFVSQTFTNELHRSLSYPQFQSVPHHGIQHLSVQGQSAHAYYIQNQKMGDYGVLGQDAVVVDACQSPRVCPSHDPRSLEHAYRVQSSSVIQETLHDHASSSSFVPYADPGAWFQPYSVPCHGSIPYPAHYQISQGYVQHDSLQKEFCRNSSSPLLYDSRIPLSQLAVPYSTQAPRDATPQTSRRPDLMPREHSVSHETLRASNEPTKEKLLEALQYSGGHTHLPRAPVFKKRRTSSCDAEDCDSGVGRSVCTSLSSLMAIHGGYSKSLNRNDV